MGFSRRADYRIPSLWILLPISASPSILEGASPPQLMKALVYTKPYHLVYTDFPDPVVGEHDVLIRVLACGICGSDVHGYTGKTGRRIPPLIMGHEAAGMVEEVGNQVKTFKRGNRVCFDSTVYCNRCEPCQSGYPNRCEQRQVLGVSTHEFKRHGAFAELVSVPWWIVSKLPDNVSFVQAALLEPTSIGLHAANRSPISSGQTVVVIGAGTIGLCIIQAARLKGATRIIVSDINEFRLGLAKKLGVEKTVNPSRERLERAVLNQTENNGAEVTIEAVGLAETLHQAIEVTRIGGHVTVVGLLQKVVDIDIQALVSKELTLCGSYANAGEFREITDLIASEKIDVEPLISKVMPLSMGQQAFDLIHKAEEDLVKIVLEP